MDKDFLLRKGLIMVALIYVLFSFLGFNLTTSYGVHNVQITAVENNGFIWKTWTAYVKSDVSSSQEETYCIDTKKIYLKDLEMYSSERTKVTITYQRPHFMPFWECDGGQAMIVDIQPSMEEGR